MWALGLLAGALGHSLLVLATLASWSWAGSLGLKCNNCSRNGPSYSDDVLETVKQGVYSDIREDIERTTLARIKEKIERSLNRSSSSPAPSRPPAVTPNTSLPAPFSQKAVRNIVRKLKQRYRTTAKIHGYEDELSEILSSAQEGLCHFILQLSYNYILCFFHR